MSGDPPWDGGPDRVLPKAVTTDYLDFLLMLEDEDFGHYCGKEIADRLKNGGIVWRLGGGEAAVSKEDGGAIVILWLPYWLDEKMHEPGEHVPISLIENWRTVELAFSALANEWPVRRVAFGFVGSDGDHYSWPWNEWPYMEAPEYLVGLWAGAGAGG
jgi:hypothetical protein